jgi:serine/threonine protein kinase
MPSAGSDSRVKSTGGHNRFLCIPLDGDSKPWSGGWEETAGKKRLNLWRPFAEESIDRFSQIQYELRRVSVVKSVDEMIYCGVDGQKYLDHWRQGLLENKGPMPAPLRSRVTVSREAVVKFLLSVTSEIAERHDRGEVHGDIKPSNILASRAALAVIDAVGLRPGEVSPLITAGWSPPEQLTRRPLDFSADVFTLGLLFLKALGGQRLGKIVKYRMPDGMEAVVVEDPTVYFGPEETALVGEGRSKWAEVLEMSLHSDPAARPSNAKIFGVAVAAAFSVERPRGNLTFRLPWGERPILSSSGGGRNEVAWVLTDSDE